LSPNPRRHIQRRRRIHGTQGRPALQPETIELLQDEPELLALADAITATQRARHRVHAKPLTVTMVAAIAVAAIAVAILVPTNGLSLQGRALAAVGDQSVLHARIEHLDSRDFDIDLRTGKATPVRVAVESWYDTRTGRLQLVVRRNGAQLTIASNNPRAAAAQAAELAALDPATENLLSDYRAAVRTASASTTGPPALQIDHGLVKGELRLNKHGQPTSWRSRTTGTTWRILRLDSLSSIATVAPPHRPQTRTLSTASLAIPGRDLQRLERAVRGRVSAKREIQHVETDGQRHAYSMISLEFTRGTARITECVAIVALPSCDFTSDHLTAALTPIPARRVLSLLELPRGSQAGSWLGQFNLDGLFVSIRASSIAEVTSAATHAARLQTILLTLLRP
jgi:hypothetical protein